MLASMSRTVRRPMHLSTGDDDIRLARTSTGQYAQFSLGRAAACRTAALRWSPPRVFRMPEILAEAELRAVQRHALEEVEF
jgi:hypothetical protein